MEQVGGLWWSWGGVVKGCRMNFSQCLQRVIAFWSGEGEWQGHSSVRLEVWRWLLILLLLFESFHLSPKALRSLPILASATRVLSFLIMGDKMWRASLRVGGVWIIL